MSQDELRTEYYRLKAAVYDPNTALLGVHAVLDTVRALFDHSKWVGLIHVEIGPLAQVETIYGWQVLDRILQSLSSVLHDARRESLPRESVLAQTGIYDGRFLAFLPLDKPTIPPHDVLEAATAALGARLRQKLSSPDFDSMSPPLELKLGFSAFTNQPFWRIERLIYKAIDDARAQSLEAIPRERSREKAELSRILQEGDIEILFQPIVELASSEVVGYEAFTRGPRDTALEQPMALFACSLDAGVSMDLDRLCQRTALDRARHMSFGKKLFLNALPASLLDPAFRDHLLMDLPAGISVSPADIVLEITDRNSIGDYDVFGHEVEELRTQGFLIAVDDVGTGSSSLQTIAEVRPDYIKVDGSLIRHVGDNLVKQEMLRSLSQVARSIEARVVAEGIEDEEELKIVKECGIRYGQGYLFARPARELPGDPPTA